MYKKEYITFYGFLGIGQFGGNLTRKFEEAGYSCVVANSSVEDLATRNAKNKLHFRNGQGCHKNRKKSKELLKENLFGISNAAENTLFNTMHDADFPKHFLVDGKLDIVNALPYANEMAVYGLVANGLLTDNEARIIKETKTISLDGIPEIDILLKQTDLFRRKHL